MNKIAALYVQTDGAYYGLPNIDPWDQVRDARQYDGPYPVVAHPPCQRWGKMWAGSPSFIAKTGIRKVKGDDDGCFEAALSAVRKFGGVLEHPEGSYAYTHFELIKPPRNGGWVVADDRGGWTCCVEQGEYGHYARKPTWLYAVGCDLPSLAWGKTKASFPDWAIEKYGLQKCKRIGELGFKGGGENSTARIHTPEMFRDILVSMARSATNFFIA